MESSVVVLVEATKIIKKQSKLPTSACALWGKNNHIGWRRTILKPMEYIQSLEYGRAIDAINNNHW